MTAIARFVIITALAAVIAVFGARAVSKKSALPPIQTPS